MKKKLITPLIIGAYLILIYLLVLVESQSPERLINTYADGLWYFLVTMTTVGYGDSFPVTTFGKLIGGSFVFSSIGVLGYFISKLTVNINNYLEKIKMGGFGTKMKNHVVVVGYDKFSHHIIQQIISTGKKVAIVTNNKDDIDGINDFFEKDQIFILYSDFQNFENLEKVNISKSAKVFVNFEDDTEMLVYVLDLKNYFSDLDFVVSLNNINNL